MDVLDLDPAVLESTAAIVEGYCNRQKSIMDDYLSSTSSLSSDWTDDQTLGPLLEEIKRMKNNVTTLMIIDTTNVLCGDPPNLRTINATGSNNRYRPPTTI